MVLSFHVVFKGGSWSIPYDTQRQGLLLHSKYRYMKMGIAKS